MLSFDLPMMLVVPLSKETTRIRRNSAAATRMGEKIPTLVTVGCQEPEFDTATMPEYFEVRDIKLLHFATTPG